MAVERNYTRLLVLSGKRKSLGTWQTRHGNCIQSLFRVVHGPWATRQ